MQISTLEAFGFRAGESHATLQVRLKAGGKSEVFHCSAVSFSWPSAPTGPGLTQEANPGSLQMKGWQSGTWRGPLCWASLGQNPHSLFLTQPAAGTGLGALGTLRTCVLFVKTVT